MFATLQHRTLEETIVWVFTLLFQKHCMRRTRDSRTPLAIAKTIIRVIAKTIWRARSILTPDNMHIETGVTVSVTFWLELLIQCLECSTPVIFVSGKSLGRF